MTFEKIDNVTWLPTATNARRRAEADVESAGRFDRSLADREAAVGARSGADGAAREFSGVGEQLRTLLTDQSVLTDPVPAIRDQFDQVEDILAQATPLTAQSGGQGPAVIVELYPGVRFNTDTDRLEFNSASHDRLDSQWLTSDQLSRDQVLAEAQTMLDSFEDRPTQLNQFVAHSFVPDAVLDQRFNLSDPIVVTQNREFQLMRLDDAGRVSEVEILEADGSIISSSHYDEAGDHRYREYYEDGRVGLEIAYEGDQQIREVSYFDADENLTAREYYDSAGAVTHTDQFDSSGNISPAG